VDTLSLVDVFGNSDQAGRYYADGCCHPNDEGHGIILREIATRLAAAVERGP
jgi:hypothetical protein